jgi:hypothetical protein
MFTPTTESRYWEMLGVLPPAYMDGHGFLVGEPMDHRHCRVTKVVRATYSAFLFHQGKFYESKEALTLPEYKAKILPA